jgi:hypothetical protein
MFYPPTSQFSLLHESRDARPVYEAAPVISPTRRRRLRTLFSHRIAPSACPVQSCDRERYEAPTLVR